VIVFIEPDRFRESFQQEVGALLEKLVSVRQMTQKKRQLTVFLINQVTPEIQKQFQDKYNSDIETDSILMLRNKYIQSFYSFTPEDYFENKEYLLKYFAKINKLSEKNFDKMQDILKFLPASNTIILLYSKKGSKDERNFKRRFNIIQTQPHYSKNSNIHWMLIDDFTAQKLKIENPIEGQMYFLFKTSKLNNYK
jgi:hypothetical protein